MDTGTLAEMAGGVLVAALRSNRGDEALAQIGALFERWQFDLPSDLFGDTRRPWPLAAVERRELSGRWQRACADLLAARPEAEPDLRSLAESLRRFSPSSAASPQAGGPFTPPVATGRPSGVKPHETTVPRQRPDPADPSGAPAPTGSPAPAEPAAAPAAPPPASTQQTQIARPQPAGPTTAASPASTQQTQGAAGQAGPDQFAPPPYRPSPGSPSYAEPSYGQPSYAPPPPGGPAGFGAAPCEPPGAGAPPPAGRAPARGGGKARGSKPRQRSQASPSRRGSDQGKRQQPDLVMPWGNDPVSRAIRSAVRPGVLAFNPPAEMTQGHAERVEVGIGRSADLLDELTSGLRGRGEVRVEDVPTSAFMSAELRGGSFVIVPLSPAEQIVAPTARWEFDITARNAGVQTLTLCINMRFAETGPLAVAGSRIAVPVVERQIRIRVNVRYGARAFVGQNWQWLVGTAVAIGGAIAAFLAVFH